MYTLKNKNSYYNIITILPLLGAGAIFLYANTMPFTELLLILCIEILLLTSIAPNKFTKEITITSEKLTIRYVSFYLTKQINIPTSLLQMTLQQNKSWNHVEYFLLAISEDGRPKYLLKSTQGDWTEDELLKLIAFHQSVL